MSKLEPMLGLVGGVLFKDELSRGPIYPSCKERKIKEHNAGLSAPKVAWVEQNTEQKAKPSTHAQYIGVLIIIIDIVIFQQQVPSWNDLHLHLQLTTL